MGCASAKHVSAVQNEEEAQKGKNYQNGDVFGAVNCRTADLAGGIFVYSPLFRPLWERVSWSDDRDLTSS
ncbi:hypothetical protein EYD10_12089 [Varanus komodoensis]|nr:hypothetical protein EYD10_12089 [Varanus komodoensis]